MTSDCTPRYVRGRPLRGRQAGGGRGLAEPHRRRRRPDRRHRQPELRQSRTARDHGPDRPRHRRHGRGLPRARLPGRERQRLALQRDRRRRDSAHPDRRRRGPDPTTTPSAMGCGSAQAGRPAGADRRDPRRTRRRSLYLRELFGQEAGAPPPVDLAVERQNGYAVRGADSLGPAQRLPRPVGRRPARAAAEMALASGVGVALHLDGGQTAQGWLFGEDQARYLLAVPAGTRGPGAGRGLGRRARRWPSSARWAATRSASAACSPRRSPPCASANEAWLPGLHGLGEESRLKPWNRDGFLHGSTGQS